MDPALADRASRRRLGRRDFLWLMSLASASVALPSLSGCARHPVTGETMLVGLSEDLEKAIDRRYSPHQFSRDFGPVQDGKLNAYVTGLGDRLAARSHRPQMPYSYRVVNANYVNAYTFPGGSMAVTRGILLGLENEAELAALLGHELGHVNARHSAQSAGQGLLATVALTGLQIAVQGNERSAQWAPLVNLASQIGASALLASYSRQHEREADALGLEYMARAGYPPAGMTGLMNMLVRESKEKPGLLETMFSSHPMSGERLENMQAAAKKYAALEDVPAQRERYLDATAPLRTLRPAIEAQQQGERSMSRRNLPEAEERFDAALKVAPRDYTGLLLMARCQTALRRHDRARELIAQAREVYPQEGQAMQLAGVNALARRDYGAALTAFDLYDRSLPGDPNAAFYKGVAHESLQDRGAAAREYRRYLAEVKDGEQARHAVSRLSAWGMLR